mmetsp:Transcript_9135/g.24527  ORF Transcript_9135/g.24527 Transcript_9135/m.24527 type:complete len:329 (-) Transcript_9135:140-1126(-)
MRPEHDGDARVREQVRVPRRELRGVLRERPVALRCGRVVVLNERERLSRPDSGEAWHAVSILHEQPHVAGRERVHDGTLEREVERSHARSSLVHVVAENFARRIPWIVSLVVVPVLRHAHLTARSDGALDVLAQVADVVASHKVESQAVKSDVARAGHVREPRRDSLAHLGIVVVNIWRGWVVRLALRVARSCESVDGVVAAERPRAPVDSPFVVAHLVAVERPVSVLVLLVAAPVVDDDIHHSGDSVRVKRSDKFFEFLLGSVPAVEFEESAWQVPFPGDTVGWRWQPHVCDSHFREVGRHSRERRVPARTNFSVRPRFWLACVRRG